MPFPFADGTGSPVLDELVGGPAAALTAVALVVAPGARASGWGARAAAALAAGWRGPRRVLLADLDLERPALHEAAGVPNDEGVIDLIEYGMSVGRLIRSAGGGTYDFLPAGIFTPDPEGVLRHEGWSRVLMEVAARRGTLLAWVPSDAAGVDEVVRRAGAVLVLAEPGEGRDVAERLPHPYAVLGILTPEAVAETVAGPATAATPGATVAPPPPEPQPQPAPEPQPEPEPEPEPQPEPEPEPEPEPSAEVPTKDLSPAAPFHVDVDAATAAPELPLVAGETGPQEAVAEPPGEARLADDPASREPVGETPDDARLADDPASREALADELRERQRSARLAGAGNAAGPSTPAPAPAAGTAAAAAGIPPGPSATERDRKPAEARARAVKAGPRKVKRYRRPLLWTLGVVLLASLLAGAWHYLSGRLERLPSAAAPQPDPPPAPAAPIEQNALPFVVAIEAHRELPLALSRVADLSEIEPELLFHVEPLEREGTLFYHVMAGPVADSAAALALRDTLIARGHKTAATPTDVRATPLAFLIGDYSTRRAALEQRSILRRLDIPAYVVAGTAVDGAALYRLYVGGFGSDAEADVMRQMLRSAGIRDSLVTRTGSAAQPNDLDTESDSAIAALSPANMNEK